MEAKKRTNQLHLRLVVSRDSEDSDANSSSIDSPVTADSRFKFPALGKLSPFSHSQMVGCETPTSSPSADCVISASERKRLSRFIAPNIGETDENAIGRTYVSIRHAPKMGRTRLNSEEENFLTRAMRVAKITKGAGVTVTNIATWAGVSQPSASGWKYGPKIENAVKLAKEIGAQVQYLYTGEGPMMTAEPPDSALVELLDHWPALQDPEKHQLVGIAIARTNPPTAQAPAKKRRSSAA